MTTIEALRVLRGLALRLRAEQPADTRLLGQVLDTFREVAEEGVNPIAELRIRRFRRLTGDGGVDSNGRRPRVVT